MLLEWGSRRHVKRDAGCAGQIRSQNLDSRSHLAGGRLCFQRSGGLQSGLGFLDHDQPTNWCDYWHGRGDDTQGNAQEQRGLPGDEVTLSRSYQDYEDSGALYNAWPRH